MAKRTVFIRRGYAELVWAAICLIASVPLAAIAMSGWQGDFKVYAPWLFGFAVALTIILGTRGFVLHARYVEAHFPVGDDEERMPVDRRAAIVRASGRKRTASTMGVVLGAVMIVAGLTVPVAGLAPSLPEDGVEMRVPETFTVAMEDGSTTTMEVIFPLDGHERVTDTSSLVYLGTSIEWRDEPQAARTFELMRYDSLAPVRWAYQAQTPGVLPEEIEDGAVVPGIHHRGTVVTVDDPTISGIDGQVDVDDRDEYAEGSVWAVSFDRLAAIEHGTITLDRPLWMYQSPFSGLLAVAPWLLIGFGILLLIDGLLLRKHHRIRQDRAVLEVQS